MSFTSINEQNKLSLNKGGNIDAVYYSELNEWFTNNAFRSFSLKYVIDKCIYYKTGNKEYAVQSGNLLLACQQPYVKAYFDSKEKVKSICIDISPATVAEAFSVISANGNSDFENYLSQYFIYPEFFESVCPAGSTTLSAKLNGLVNMIKNGETWLINKEWFMDLAEKIIYHEYGNYLALNGIHSIKLSTRKEILERLGRGKQYMDDNFMTIADVNEVAVASNLSEFHFFRSFRQAFNITPYQYLLNKRLDFARQLLETSIFSITEISARCNFPDLATFSKAFKRKFGFAPSQIR